LKLASLERARREGNFWQDPERLNWLKSKNIVVLGKGATAGGPILKYLNKLSVNPTQIDSKTPSPDELIKKADIVISAVGKPNTITPEKIKKDVTLIGVGIFRGEDGKLHGDYDEANIKNIAGFYTPTPGGVGPVNVAMLLDNLLNTTEKQTKKTA
jgi:methylenetetrahydrofolate dehydrogenase (NADP+)/methenyltetrahydrofolate cyclohydrolase